MANGFVLSSLPRRSAALAYGRGSMRISDVCFVKPPRWGKSGDGRSIMAFFNKRLGILLLQLPLLLLAGHGGEGEKERDEQTEMLSSYTDGETGASSEWEGLSLSGAPWWSSSMLSADRCWNNQPTSWIPLRANFFRFPPPTHGRRAEFDGGPMSTGGFGDESSAVRCFCLFHLLLLLSGAEVAKDRSVVWGSSSVEQQWRWEAISWRITSAASDGRPTSLAKVWPIQKPAMISGVYTTSFVRPLSRLAAAYYGCTGASGFVPASGHDSGVADFRLGGGEREGPNCFPKSFSEVFSANTRDLYVIMYLMGSFVTVCTSTAWI